MESQGYPVPVYSYIFLPRVICPPLEMDTVDKLVFLNALGIQILDALAWLSLHKHGWEYYELLQKNIMEEFKQLTFR